MVTNLKRVTKSYSTAQTAASVVSGAARIHRVTIANDAATKYSLFDGTNVTGTQICYGAGLGEMRDLLDTYNRSGQQGYKMTATLLKFTGGATGVTVRILVEYST